MATTVVSVVWARYIPKNNFCYESANGDALISLNERFGGLLSRERLQRSVGLVVASSRSIQMRSSYSVSRWGVQSQVANGWISAWVVGATVCRETLQKSRVCW